jgi:hypothetical protein
VIASTALTLTLLVGANGALDLGIQAEGRTRSTDPTAVQGNRLLVDASLSPRIQVQLVGPGSTFTLGYDPRLAWTNLGRSGAAQPTQLDVLHSGRLGVVVAPDLRYTLTFRANGAVGRTDLVTLRQTQPTSGPPQVIPTTASIPYRNARAELTLRLAPDRRSTWTVGTTVAQDGGTTAAGQALLPNQRTVTARLDYAWNATRLDALGLRLDGTGSELTATRNRSAFANGLGTWRRQLSPTVSASAGAGGVWLYSEPTPSGPARQRFLPAAEASLAATGIPEVIAPDPVAAVPRPVVQPLRANVSARLGAGIDRLSGEVSQQLDGEAGISWTPVENLTLSARGSAAVAWQTQGRSRRTGLDLRASWAAWPRLRPELGAYVTQQQPVAPTPAFTEYGVSLGVSLDAPTQRWRSP